MNEDKAKFILIEEIEKYEYNLREHGDYMAEVDRVMFRNRIEALKVGIEAINKLEAVKLSLKEIGI